MNAAAIGRKYAKYLRKARPDHYIRHHKNMGHVGKEPRKTELGTLSDIKAERHRKSVDERIDELYNLALAGCKLAIQKGEPDVRGLASCIAQGIAATELMGKGESPDANKGASAIIAYVESEKAKEHQ